MKGRAARMYGCRRKVFFVATGSSRADFMAPLASVVACLPASTACWEDEVDDMMVGGEEGRNPPWERMGKPGDKPYCEGREQSVNSWEDMMLRCQCRDGANRV